MAADLLFRPTQILNLIVHSVSSVLSANFECVGVIRKN